jgi:hypothetical protein
MAKGDTTRANKRKFGSGKGSPYAAAPRKGPPAIFVSCESGREKKCQREALELLHHYYYLSKQAQDEINDTTIHQQTPSGEHLDAKDDANPTSDMNGSNNDEHQQQQEKQPLSLEEELSLLRKGVMAEEVLTYQRNSKRHKGDENAKHGNKNKLSSMKSPFSVYDSGVRGMICILCNLPGCEVIPYDDIVARIHAARKDKAENETSSTTNGCSENIKIRAIKETGNEEDTNQSDDETKQTLWDPVDTVKRIMEGVVGESNPTNASKALSSPPSSRFISRMLPMQATVSCGFMHHSIGYLSLAIQFTLLHFHIIIMIVPIVLCIC